MAETIRRTDEAPAGRRVRLGLVSYLNARPIGYGLLEGRQRGRFDVPERIPSALADGLARAELDFALIPSVEYARAWQAGRPLRIVPGIAIASNGPARSVLLFARRPLPLVRSVALDDSSRTSAALLRLLMKRRLRPGLPEPDYVTLREELPAMIEAHDAALVIGDPALMAARRYPELCRGLQVVDLGEEWKALTGLPFVFAVWAGPPREDAPEIVAALQDSLREVREKIPDIARRASEGDPALGYVIVAYLTEAIRYTLGRDEIRATKTFFQLLAEEGWLDAPPPDLVFHPTQPCQV